MEARKRKGEGGIWDEMIKKKKYNSDNRNVVSVSSFPLIRIYNFSRNKVDGVKLEAKSRPRLNPAMTSFESSAYIKKT